MLMAYLAVLLGLIMLVWSADRFVDGASSLARHFGMSPLLIGMVIVGFGTSAPELAVSALASLQGNTEVALGNAYGSNIANIGLILGITAVLSPIVVKSEVVRRELPLLTAVTLLAVPLYWDGLLTRANAGILLCAFALIMTWSIVAARRNPTDILGKEVQHELVTRQSSRMSALMWVVLGVVLLVASSRVLVWGAVEIAQYYGVSDLVIGLTIVAIGTSLPELASSIVAVRKKEHDIALGNVLGSNLFNTLAVVGLAGLIRPAQVSAELMSRDLIVMGGMTGALFILSYGFKGQGRISRIDGLILLLIYVGYNIWLVRSEIFSST